MSNSIMLEHVDWLTKGLSKKQLQTERILTLIAGKIHLKRLELKLDQKGFAKYMGVSQGLISRWESGNYNFTISTLVDICEKLNITFDPRLVDGKVQFKNVHFVSKKSNDKGEWSEWKPSNDLNDEEGVA